MSMRNEYEYMKRTCKLIYSLTFNPGPESSDKISRVYPGNNMTGG